MTAGTASLPDAETARRWFWGLLIGTTLLRLILAAGFPLTGDEAYFFVWGRNPALGYYDHPPMVGWWLALLMQAGEALGWLRLPAPLTAAAVGLGLVWLLRPFDERLAWLGGALYLVSPLTVAHFVITTDTPLILFAFLATGAFVRGVQQERLAWFAAAGLFLGLALLSKFFAGLLAVAFAAWWFFAPDRRRAFTGILVTALVAAPFFAFNLWWNYQHCWNNYLFNFINRNTTPAPWYAPLLYLLTLLWVLTPPVVWHALRRRGAETRGPVEVRRLLAVLAGVPLLLLGLLSLGKIIGVHWLLGFHAVVLAWLALARGASALWTSLRFNLWFGGLHALLFLAIAFVPWLTLPVAPGLHHRLVDALGGDAIWQAIEPLAQGRHLFTRGYVGAADLSWRSGRHVGVIGPGSRYAREDDRLTDFHALDGENFLIFLYKKRDTGQYRPWFEHMEVRRVPVLGTEFEIVLGDGFKYEVYREQVLRAINDRYYRIPPLLPAGRCGFKERYGLP